MKRLAASLTAAVLGLALGCGGAGDGAQMAPPGSCKTGGTATGSYSEPCNQCAVDNCKNWTSNSVADAGRFGTPMSLTEWAANMQSQSCNTQLPVYCLSNP